MSVLQIFEIALNKKVKFPIKAKKKNALVSGNAGDEKNLYPDGRKLIFLN